MTRLEHRTIKEARQLIAHAKGNLTQLHLDVCGDHTMRSRLENNLKEIGELLDMVLEQGDPQ